MTFKRKQPGNPSRSAAKPPDTGIRLLPHQCRSCRTMPLARAGFRHANHLTSFGRAKTSCPRTERLSPVRLPWQDWFRVCARRLNRTRFRPSALLRVLSSLPEPSLRQGYPHETWALAPASSQLPTRNAACHAAPYPRRTRFRVTKFATALLTLATPFAHTDSPFSRDSADLLIVPDAYGSDYNPQSKRNPCRGTLPERLLPACMNRKELRPT